MPDYYGLPQAGTGGVPAGGEHNVAYFVMQAPIDKHLRIVALDFDGGDANENYNLYLFPPTTVFPTAAGTPPPNAIVWMSGSVKGNPDFPSSFINRFGGEGVESGWLVLPAGWFLGVVPVTAASAAALPVQCVGLPFDAA